MVFNREEGLECEVHIDGNHLLLMLGIYSLSILASCMKHCLYLFLCLAETMLWKEESTKIRAVQMENLRGLLGFRRMDRIPNAPRRELCGLKGLMKA